MGVWVGRRACWWGGLGVVWVGFFGVVDWTCLGFGWVCLVWALDDLRVFLEVLFELG